MTDPLVARLRAAGCVFAEDEARLLREAAGSTAELEALLSRRLGGEPLEHVLGWAEIDGVRVAVGPGVFVPRRRSRVLVAATLEELPEPGGREPVVVELCCGAAAIATAVARARPDAQVWASDIDPVAVEIARRNLPADRVVQGDLFEGLPASLLGRVDVVVANAPYVPTDELHLMPVESREHEPVQALDGGADGVGVHRLLAAAAGRWLTPGGALIIETSRRQAAATQAAMVSHDLTTAVRHDEEIDGTAVVGRHGQRCPGPRRAPTPHMT